MALFPDDWIIPEWSAPSNVKAVITTRRGGESTGPYAEFNLGDHVGDDSNHVRQNRRSLERFLPSAPRWLNQVHGNVVLIADTITSVPAADASIARGTNVVCAVMTADCLPILLTDRQGNTVAVAHAGWQGLRSGVIENTVKQMAVSPEDILVHLGPAIGPQAYVVGDDIRNAFLGVDDEAITAFTSHAAGKWHMDLYQLARQRLAKSGVTNVTGGGFCTFSDSQRFFSYRRDGITGRIATLIWRSEN